MIKSCKMTEQDVKRLNELKVATEASTESEVIRQALREYHKKIFATPPSVDGAKETTEGTER